MHVDAFCEAKNFSLDNYRKVLSQPPCIDAPKDTYSYRARRENIIYRHFKKAPQEHELRDMNHYRTWNDYLTSECDISVRDQPPRCYPVDLERRNYVAKESSKLRMINADFIGGDATPTEDGCALGSPEAFEWSSGVESEAHESDWDFCDRSSSESSEFSMLSDLQEDSTNEVGSNTVDDPADGELSDRSYQIDLLDLVECCATRRQLAAERKLQKKEFARAEKGFMPDNYLDDLDSDLFPKHARSAPDSGISTGENQNLQIDISEETIEKSICDLHSQNFTIPVSNSAMEEKHIRGECDTPMISYAISKSLPRIVILDLSPYFMRPKTSLESALLIVQQIHPVDNQQAHARYL